jgi:4-amino-4-deoxy-L-arabinose transferase-like glycosyltransferase
LTSRVLGIVLVVAFLLRLGFGFSRSGLETSADESHWVRLAQHFAELGPLHPDTGTYRPPLYALFLAVVFDLVGPDLQAVRVLQGVLSTVTCALLFLIGRHIGGDRVGLVAAALGSGYPLFVFFAGVLMAETLLILLAVLSLYLSLAFQDQPSLWRAVALGAALGLGALCKPVMLAWAVLLAGGMVILPGRVSIHGAERGSRTKHGTAMIVALCLVIAPWTMRNNAVTGHLVPISTNAGMNLLIGHEPEARGVYRDGADYVGLLHRITGIQPDAVSRERAALAEVFSWMVAAPGRTLMLAVRKLVLFWSPIVAGESALRNLVAVLSYLPVVGLGAWGTWQLRRHPVAWPVASLALSLSIVHALFFAHTRFRLPVDAALMVPAAWSITHLYSKWRRS